MCVFSSPQTDLVPCQSSPHHAQWWPQPNSGTFRPPTWTACTSCPFFCMLLFSVLSRWARSESVENTGVDDECLCPSLPPQNLLPSTCHWRGGRAGLCCESSSIPCSLPEPGAECSLPAASYGQGPGPMFVRKKMWPHSEQRSLPFALEDEALHSVVSLLEADACCCPAAQANQWPHHKEFLHKNGTKSLKKPSSCPMTSEHLMESKILWIHKVFTVPELTDSKESLNTWTIAALMLWESEVWGKNHESFHCQEHFLFVVNSLGGFFN